MNRYVLPLHRIPLPGERLLHDMKPIEVVGFDHYTSMLTGADTTVVEIRYLAAEEDGPVTAKVIASHLSEEFCSERRCTILDTVK